MNETPRKKPSMIAVALSLVVASTGVDLLQIIHHLATSPIGLLETFSNWFVLGSTLGGACLGAFMALLWYLYPKTVSKTQLWCIGLVVPLFTTISMLRSSLDINNTPLSTVLGVVAFALLCYELNSIKKTTPEDRS